MKRIVLLILCFMLSLSTAVAEQDSLATLWGIEWGEPIETSLKKIENVTGLTGVPWEQDENAAYQILGNDKAALLNVPITVIWLRGEDTLSEIDIRFVVQEDPAQSFYLLYQALADLCGAPSASGVLIPQITLAGKEQQVRVLPAADEAGIDEARDIAENHNEFTFAAFWYNVVLAMGPIDGIVGISLMFASSPYP